MNPQPTNDVHHVRDRSATTACTRQRRVAVVVHMPRQAILAERFDEFGRNAWAVVTAAWNGQQQCSVAVAVGLTWPAIKPECLDEVDRMLSPCWQLVSTATMSAVLP